MIKGIMYSTVCLVISASEKELYLYFWAEPFAYT